MLLDEISFEVIPQDRLNLILSVVVLSSRINYVYSIQLKLGILKLISSTCLLYKFTA